MTLREMAELAANDWAACGEDWRTIRDGKPCPSCKNQVSSVADAIESVAKEFADKTLRQIYEVDDNDKTGSDGERTRGGFRVLDEYAGRHGLEWRYYRADFVEMISDIIAAAERGE